MVEGEKGAGIGSLPNRFTGWDWAGFGQDQGSPQGGEPNGIEGDEPEDGANQLGMTDEGQGEQDENFSEETNRLHDQRLP